MADIIHLNLTGIRGESTSQRHRDEIVVETWNWGVAAPPPLSSTGGAAGVLKPTFAPFTFAHRIDLASALLWRACLTGQRIAEGILSIARPMATAGDYLTLRMQDVVIGSVGLADASADTQPPLETVTLNCSFFEYTYRPQLANGSLGPAAVLKFDIRQNRVV